MNTYDPADLILYVHVVAKTDASSLSVAGGTACTALPSDYANQSPRTRLQRRPPRVCGDQAGFTSFSA
jgi:hypothetical protein